MSHFADIADSVRTPSDFSWATMLIASESITDDVMLGVATNGYLGLILVALVDNRWHDITDLAVEWLDGSSLDGSDIKINGNFSEAKQLLGELEVIASYTANADRIKEFIATQE